MYPNTQASTETRQQEHLLTTIIPLLDRKQPYEKFEHLDCPDIETSNNRKLLRIQGSLVGLAIGDALGASVEFRPHSYLQQYKVKDMQDGGTWGLKAGQWTDDTSMTLCLAASLIVKGEFDPYDQFIRYKRWYRDGYMSSTGLCFDIGKSTRQAIIEFENRQKKVLHELLQKKQATKDTSLDEITKQDFLFRYDLICGPPDSAGNGSLMRLAPIPLFFSESYDLVKQYIDQATILTHNDTRAIEACQFYAGLIWHALNGKSKEDLLHPDFYRRFLNINLHGDVLRVVQGSYKNKNGYEDGIRGKGYVVNALEAALWAFHNDGNSFDKGVLLAVNLGDDTDTTAAIYGQLAGAVYGIDCISPDWVKKLFQGKFIKTLANALYVRGKSWKSEQRKPDESNGDDRNRRHTSGDNKGSSDSKPSGTGTSHPNQKVDVNSTSHHAQSTASNNISDRDKSRNMHNASHQGGQGNMNDAPHGNDKINVIPEY